MSAASTEEIIRVVELCPTKALFFKWNKDMDEDKKKEPIEENQGELKEKKSEVPSAEIKVMPDGPLVIKGEYKIIGEDGKEIKKMKITSLCRCGQSNNMPFCDGMHRKVGWFSR
jgi:Fe-S-cluster-containing dehydrogenase component